MKRKFTKLAAAFALLAALCVPLGMWGQSPANEGGMTRDYAELYSATFTDVATHSYTQNKTFTLNGKSWTASVSQVNGGVFYLGCNSNNASKGVLNNNSTFADVVTTLRSNDETYNANYTTAHAYALLFENAFDDVTKIDFDWAGGNNAFQVYLFGDSGSGYEMLGYTNYAESGAAVAGNVEWIGNATNYTKFAIVARPGTPTTTATNKTLRASTFKIYKTVSGETVAKPVISPNGGNFVNNQEVTITCATDGAAIHYSYVSEEGPWSDYTAALNLTQTTTVYAYATKDGMEDSDVAEATFTKVTPLENIAALTANTEAGTYYVTMDNAVVTFASGNYAYIQDATGAVLYYKNGHGLQAGNVLNGTAAVYFKLQNSLPEITSLSGVTPESGTAPVPTVVAQSAWNYTFNNVLSQYFQITGATITQTSGKYYISLNNESIQLYKVGGTISSIDLNRTYTVTGFPTLYNTTKELQIFDDPVVEATTDPIITINPTAAQSFTYVVGEGPSAEQIFEVTGENLTSNDIVVSVAQNSNFEITDDEEYGYTLTIASGDMFSIRMKAGLEAGSYSGTVTLSSQGATDVTIALTGTVTEPEAPNVTWDLSIASYDEITDPDIVTWSSEYATMTNSSKSGGTSASNYLGGDSNNRTSSRFYNGNTLTIAPVAGYAITSVVFTATTEGYASALANSTWTNATASTNGTTVTVTPGNGATAMVATIGATCGFTSVSVYYVVNNTPSITVTPLEINVDAEYHQDVLTVTYTNVDPYSNISVAIYYDAEGHEIDPTWLLVELMTDKNFSYTIPENYGGARTAYFKIRCNGVYSDMVTVNQAAYVTPPTPGNWVLTSIDELTENDVFVIVGDNGSTYAMSNDNGTSSAPAAVSVTVVDNTLSGEIDDNLQWNISSTESGYIFYPNGTTETWLYCTDANNSVRVGTDDGKLFTIDEGYLKNVATERYVGIYNSQDWRCYTSHVSSGNQQNNIEGQTFAFYKKVEEESYTLEITGYTDDNTKDGYYLIASPVSVDPYLVGMADGEFDLYYFDQSEDEEWRNFEAGSFTMLEPGKGYLYAKKATDNVQTYYFNLSGTPYVGDGIIDLTYDVSEGVDFPGLNLIGNPFGEEATLNLPFYRMNLAGSGFEAVEETESTVNAMEGVFVYAEYEDGYVTNYAQFTPNGNTSGGGGMKINLTRNRGAVIDNAIVRFDNGRQLPKFQLFENSTKLYIPQGNKDYAIVRSAAEAEMPVSFRASENGTYTLAVEAENVEMNYLHLIDNLTGMDVDLLQTPSYTFEAKTSDYTSRFRLVFKANGTNENNAESVAYFNGTNWTVSNVGEATLQVVDVTGRTVANQMINGNAELNLNQPAGVYVIRLVNGDNVKTQKVVVR